MVQNVMHPVLGYVYFSQAVKTMPEDYKEAGAYEVPTKPTELSEWDGLNKKWVEPKPTESND